MNRVYKLKKALSGSSMWYRQSQGDNILFIKHSKSTGVTILLVYVSDIIVIVNGEYEKIALKLIYLSHRMTDIAHTVNVVNQFMHK